MDILPVEVVALFFISFFLVRKKNLRKKIIKKQLEALT